eukprot:4232690-Amphidinium_carterae.2
MELRFDTQCSSSRAVGRVPASSLSRNGTLDSRAITSKTSSVFLFVCFKATRHHCSQDQNR